MEANVPALAFAEGFSAEFRAIASSAQSIRQRRARRRAPCCYPVPTITSLASAKCTSTG